MRLEQVRDGNFIKIPTENEQQIIKTMNRFFETDQDIVEGSREDIILEVQKRIRPLIANMVKRIAWLEGEEIFKQQLESVMEEEMKKILDTVMDTVSNMRKNLIKPVEIKYKITQDTYMIELPKDIIVKEDADVLHVYVNGQKQEKDENYKLVLNSDSNIVGVDFSPEYLEPTYNVKLDCLLYTEQTDAGNIIGGKSSD